MVPTRELAVQVKDEVVKLSDGRRVHCVAVYGGKPIREQIEKLRKGAQIVVGTPGRVLDHLARGTVDFSQAASSSCSTKPTGCSTSAFGRTSSGF